MRQGSGHCLLYGRLIDTLGISSMYTKSKFALVAAGLGSAAIASAGSTVVTNTDVANLAINPDNGCVDDATGTGLGGISRTIAFAETGTINDINVALEMTHTWRSDIQVGLSYSEGGGTVALANNWDGSGDNLFAQLDSESANGLCSLPANCGTNGITGCSAAPGPNCQPDQPLTAFNGLATPGTFTLTVCDRAAADFGTLDSWSVTAGIDTDNGVPLAPAIELPLFGGDFQKWLVMALMALGLITLARRFVRR